MCHGKLTIDLCNNVNFIHGQNGSGKSAILAALQICLGAGARRTHRARNLKDLVRKEGNANYAKVQVTLLNKGPDAFRHDVYGDTITIERTISLGTVSNPYKLYGADDPKGNGKPKSTKRKDLDLLLDQLNIQVENPVAVLDQEEAKKFLMGRPEDKYIFFAKATDLERMDVHYASVVDSINELDVNSAKMGSNIEPMSVNVRKLEHEVKQFQYLDDLQIKVSQENAKFAWSLYTKHQHTLDDENSVSSCHVFYSFMH